MNIQECIKNMERYQANPKDPTHYGWSFGKDGKTPEQMDKMELKRFVETLQKAIKICKRYESRRINVNERKKKRRESSL